MGTCVGNTVDQGIIYFIQWSSMYSVRSLPRKGNYKQLVSPIPFIAKVEVEQQEHQFSW